MIRKMRAFAFRHHQRWLLRLLKAEIRPDGKYNCTPGNQAAVDTNGQLGLGPGIHMLRGTLYLGQHEEV